MVKLGFAPVAVLLASAFAACGSSDSTAKDGPVASTEDTTELTAAKSGKPRGPKLKVTESDYGPILTNARGRALYLFTADTGKASTCSGDCATAWPPYVVKRKPSAGPGVKAGKIATTRRSDGRLQTTYAGHPVYFYEADDEPGEVLCQAVNEFGGYWYVLRASGKAVR